MVRKTYVQMKTGAKLEEKSATTSSRGIGFLDLPAELRNQIYALLLPDLDPWGIDPDESLRKEGEKASTAFMACHSQIHDEAASILYAGKEFEASISKTGTVTFLTTHQSFENLPTANFSALNQIKVLDLLVATDKTRTVCVVQDALFIFFSHLTAKHKLHTLNVRLTVQGGEDYYINFLVTSSYADRMYPMDVMHEYRHIQPGALSRAHVAAFLTDPLRTVRGLRDGRKGKFTLNFAGKSVRPWREIEGKVRALVRSDDVVQDYEAFRPYFEALRPLAMTLLWFSGAKFHRACRQTIDFLHFARIRGRVGELHNEHASLVEIVDNMTEKNLEYPSKLSSEQDELREQKVREIVFLMEELKAAIPHVSTDTSFYGYNIADAGLRAWQNGGKQAFEAEKAKRKREKETKGEAASKKAKTAK